MRTYTVFYLVDGKETTKDVEADDLFDLTQKLSEKLLYKDQFDSISAINLISDDGDNILNTNTFTSIAHDLKNGHTAVWTDGVSIDCDNDRHMAFGLEAKSTYRVSVTKIK